MSYHSEQNETREEEVLSATHKMTFIDLKSKHEQVNCRQGLKSENSAYGVRALCDNVLLTPVTIISSTSTLDYEKPLQVDVHIFVHDGVEPTRNCKSKP